MRRRGLTLLATVWLATLAAGPASAVAQQELNIAPPQLPASMMPGDLGDWTEAPKAGGPGGISAQLPKGTPGGPAGQTDIPPPAMPPGTTTPGTTQPGLTTPGMAGLGAGADDGFGVAGFGGTDVFSDSVFPVIGDRPSLMMGYARRARVRPNQFPPFPGPGPFPPGPGPFTPDVRIPEPTVRSIKIAENQSPLPQDRVFFSFNYFDDFGAIYNERDNNGVTNMRVYQEIFGFEKTFFDRDASIGFRLPLNSLTIDSVRPGFDDTQTSLGNLNFYLKFIIAETAWSNGERFFLTGGISVTPPTGPRNFASYGGLDGFKSTYLAPFVGYLYSSGRFYFQGFSSVEAPVGTGDSDVTFMYNDVAIGYFILNRRNQPGRLVTAMAPTFETHVNTPLNHRGIVAGDIASSADQVVFTWGINTEIRRRGIVTFGYATPVTGPNLFDGEFILQLNFLFGGSRRGGTSPALLGGPLAVPPPNL